MGLLKRYEVSGDAVAISSVRMVNSHCNGRGSGSCGVENLARTANPVYQIHSNSPARGNYRRLVCGKSHLHGTRHAGVEPQIEYHMGNRDTVAGNCTTSTVAVRIEAK